MWVRGLKPDFSSVASSIASVAPHVGAWIETANKANKEIAQMVAPHVGAWIETANKANKEIAQMVAPHVGAWIETQLKAQFGVNAPGRTPCGCVD